MLQDSQGLDSDLSGITMDHQAAFEDRSGIPPQRRDEKRHKLLLQLLFILTFGGYMGLLYVRVIVTICLSIDPLVDKCGPRSSL